MEFEAYLISNLKIIITNEIVNYNSEAWNIFWQNFAKKHFSIIYFVDYWIFFSIVYNYESFISSLYFNKHLFEVGLVDFV